MENSRISHYDIGRLLGRGGMGEVYEAVDLDLDRRVALKFVAPELAADAEALKRFEREARAAAALNHPHIATLFAFERQGARTFIAMELVGGESLRERIRRGPLPVAEALAIARDVAGALALAHRRGIVHRDVKPENLMFDQDGVVKLMDFGLARAAQASRMTMTGSTLGTAAYMPPESVRGGTGAPGDVFALGVMLHEMLTGELPFSGESPLALLYTIANEEPKPLRAARADAPEAVEELVKGMLVKDPKQRPDAATVARELAALTGTALPIGAGDTVELEVARVPTPPGAPGEARVPPAAGPLVARAPTVRRRPWLALSLIAVPVVLGLLLLGGLRGRRAARHQEAIRMTDEGVDSLRARNPTAAQARFEAALKLDPEYAKAGVSLGSALHARGDDAGAARVLRDVLQRHAADPQVSAQARGALADIDMAAGNWRGAIESLRRSFALDSSGVRAYNQLAYALIRAGQPNEAIALLSRAIPRFPGEPVLHKNLGLAELTMGDAVSATSEADRALAIDASFAPALALRARARARASASDLAGARADWARYLSLHPATADSAEVAAELAQHGVLR
jgi:Tfp pilus assembly protein PilF/tRNA A-37 threonylcarbamoyl transferase component Bud32